LGGDLKIIPFVDGHFIEDEIEYKIRRFREKGFQGLKLLYVPEEDPENRMGGMEQAFARTLKPSEAITSRLIDSACSEGMWVLLHADLRKYGEFVTEMIRIHPRTHFNIPHVGSSRKAMSFLLDVYPNCYTDLSSLTPAMERDPDTYRRFLIEYQDRVLFGSDALIGQPEHVQSTLEFIRRFLDNEVFFPRLTYKNELRFQGISGETE
jgi:predicted TIM-barrel fold metal-dependent hydrolase